MLNFEDLVEHMFRRLEKDVIACVRLDCGIFEDLKKMNVIIRQVWGKMWTETEMGDFRYCFDLAERLHAYITVINKYGKSY
jgi:hypothetical protein